MHVQADLLSFSGRPFDSSPERFDELTDSASLVHEPDALRQRYEDDGYVFVRSLLDAEIVLDARRELLLKYAMVGEIDDRDDVMSGVEGDRAGLMTANMRAFSESLRSGANYEAVILHDELIRVVGTLLGGPVRPYDFRWPRLARPGEGCGFHCDGPYMSRGTDRHLSVWTPIGSIDPQTVIVEPGQTTTFALETSPFFNADKISVPLFVAQGANDPRVRKEESDQIVDALRRRGVDVEYLVKDNEGHGFSNEENRFEFYRAMERFLDRHLPRSA